MADQIPLALSLKKFEKTISLKGKLFYYSLNKDFYNDLGNGLYLADGYVLYPYYNLNNGKDIINTKIENMENVIKNNSDLNYYLYYIERDVDINFQNNKKAGIYEYLVDNLKVDIKTQKYEINNFDEYKKYFYKTDHHWNYKGSYKAYTEILKMFNLSDPIKPIEESCVTNKLSGSKAVLLGSSAIVDDFCFYKFDLPEYKLKINNKEAEYYGSKIYYYNDNIENPEYGAYYGWDYGLVEFDFNNPKKDNLLIIGDSFDNAINDLLAIHFNKTYNVDLRNYKSSIGKEFQFKEFVKSHEIKHVLFIGNANYFISTEFNIKGDF